MPTVSQHGRRTRYDWEVSDDGTRLRELVRAPLRTVVPYDPGPSVAELAARFGVDHLVKLSWNEDLFGLLPGVREAVINELQRVSLYPEQAYADFREAVGAWTGAHADWVVPAHGIQSLVLTVVTAFVNPGERVVIAVPTYGLYRQACEASGADLVEVPTRGLRLDLEAMAEAAKGSKLVFVCDPNNPTGDTLAPGEWDRFLDAVPDGCLVAVDEAYADYLAPHERPERIRDVASGRPVVVLRTFSKLFGIAGLRLGYAIVHPALVPCLDAVQEPFNLNRPALAAGMACLSDAAAVEARRREVVAARDGFALALDRAGFACARSGANFVLTDTGVDDLALFEAMVRRGFLIRPGSEYGLPGRVRITIGPTELMTRVVDAMIESRDEIADRPPR
jgi:histidinol-phosphate aminotransferase